MVSTDSYAFAITAKNETEKAFNAIDSDLKKVNVSVRDVSAKMRSLAGPAAVGITALGAASVAAVVGITQSVAVAADEMSNLARVAGTSNEAFQGFAYGARLVNVEQEKLSDILKDTNDKIGDFIETGGGPMKDFFEQIAPQVGVTAEQFKNLSGQDALQLYVSSLEKANLSQQQMTFYMEAIASDSTLLLPLLKDNGAAMREQAEEAEKLGLVLSDVDVAMLEETNRVMLRNKEVFKGFTNQLAVEFSPLIQAVSNEFLNAAKEAGGFGNIATRVFDAVIKGAGFAADIIRGLEVVWHGIKLAVATAMDINLAYFEAVESGIRSIAQYIPGVEVSAETALGNIRQSVQNVKEQIKQDIADAVNAPMPSDQLEIWSEEIKTKAAEVAREIAAAKNGRTNSDEAANDISFEEDPEVIAAMAKMEHLNLLKDLQLASDKEREELEHLERMEALQERFEGEELPKLMEYKQLKEQLEAKHQENLLKIEGKGAYKRAQFEKKTMKQQAQQVFGQLANITQGVANHNKGLFKLNKAAGIANAVINTYQGVTEALAAYPPPISFIMAASQLAAGMAQVNAIKGQQFGGSTGGGGSISSGSVAVGTTPITSAPSNIANSAAANDAQRPQNVTNVTINIDPDEVYTGRRVRDLIENIAEQTSELNVGFS